MNTARPTHKSMDSNNENYISNDDIGNISVVGLNNFNDPRLYQNTF
jgi:hypothetical protein